MEEKGTFPTSYYEANIILDTKASQIFEENANIQDEY